MAPITVKLADGTNLEFEEGTADDVIDRVVQEHIASAPAPAAGAEAAPADAVPFDDAVPEALPEGGDVAGYESGLREYYQKLATSKGAFDPSIVSGMASKYGVGTIANLSAVEDFYKKYGTLNPRLAENAKEAPPPVKQDEIIGTVPQSGDMTQRARAFGKGAFFDFADEAEAAARMLASGQMSSDEYYRVKNQINADFNAWAKANPAEALGYELAGGITSTFIPGVGLVGKGVQGITGLSKVASVAGRAAGTGALSGALSGLGQAETMKVSDLAPSLIENAALGAGFGTVLGKTVEIGGRGLANGAQRLRERYGKGLEVWDDTIGDYVRVPQRATTPEELRASEALYAGAGSRGPQRAIGETALANRSGVSTRLGNATPEMAALTETVLAKPNAGREELIKGVLTDRAATGERVTQQVEDAIPNGKDYFDEEEAISARLRAIGDNEYKAAYAVGEVRDPDIDAIVRNPALASVWQRAESLAQLKGSKLNMEMEPVLDAGGSLIGLRPTGNSIPNVEALDLFKRALDDKINAGFRGQNGLGKAEASALKDLRNVMVGKLDTLVPAYKAARAKYAGDMEVRDALRYGLDVLKGKIRPAELRKELANMSVAEREAVKSGAMEAMFRTIEGSSGRNLAKQIAGTTEKIKKLEAVMGPAEFKFFDRAMRRESEVYQRTSKIIGGSRTAPLAESMRQLDDAIAGGNLDDAVNFVLAGPVGKTAALARWVGRLNPRKEFGDRVYTQLSKALAAQKPEQLREVLDMLRRSQSYAQLMNSVKDEATGRVATVAGNVLPSTLEDKGTNPPPFSQIASPDEEELLDVPEIEEATVAEDPSAEFPFPEDVVEDVPQQGTVMMNGRPVIQADGGRWLYADDSTEADGVPMGYAEGGSVQRLKRGGSAGYDYGNAARTFGQGLTFGTADEIEAFMRAGLDRKAYERERNSIRLLQEQYAERNPKMAMALEGVGMVGGSMLAPSLGGARMLANAPRAMRFAAAGADELAQGAAYAAGQAKSMRDIPRAVRDDTLINAAFFGGTSGAAGAGKYAVRKAVGTGRGYQTALAVKRLLGKH